MIRLDHIENVYSDPWKEREKGLSQSYICTKTSDSSPGKSVNIAIDYTSESYQKIMKYFNDKNMSVYICQHVYRIATKHDLAMSTVHRDHNHFHVIVSLTPDHHLMNDYEQSFVIDNTTYNDITWSSEEPFDFIREQYDDEYKTKCDIALKNLNKKDYVKPLSKVQFCFNKAIIINATYLHYPTNCAFGNTIEDGRLIEIYSLRILSMIHVPKSIPYRFVWYYQNIFSESVIKELYEYVYVQCEQEYVTRLENKNNALILDVEDLYNYKNGLLQKCISVYISYIIENTGDLFYLFNKHTSGRTSHHVIRRLHMNIVSVREGENFEWICECIPSSTFVGILHLNDNDTGISLVDHFENKTILIPSIKNSLAIFPNSWLYPFRQTTVFTGSKNMIWFYLSI